MEIQTFLCPVNLLFSSEFYEQAFALALGF